MAMKQTLFGFSFLIFTMFLTASSKNSKCSPSPKVSNFTPNFAATVRKLRSHGIITASLIDWFDWFLKLTQKNKHWIMLCSKSSKRMRRECVVLVFGIGLLLLLGLGRLLTAVDTHAEEWPGDRVKSVVSGEFWEIWRNEFSAISHFWNRQILHCRRARQDCQRRCGHSCWSLVQAKFVND